MRQKPNIPALWGRFVPLLGVTQVIGYGSIYYAYPILVPHISAEFGVAPTSLFAVLSAGLLLGGLLSPYFGGLLDRLGAPNVMAMGSLAAGGLMLGLAAAPNFASFAVMVVLLEALSFAVLYDAAFATLALREPQATRTAITRLTLIGGFASTLFWPLTGLLAEMWGWRGTYLAYAAMHLGLALPLHFWIARQATPAVSTARAETRARPNFAPVAPGRQRWAFWVLGLSYAVTGMVIAAIGVHLVPILLARDLGQVAFVMGMLMGPSQVAIRLVEAGFWRNWHPLSVALVSGAAVPVALLALLVPLDSVLLAAAFAIIFGAGQGLSSIVRGSVPLVLFGAAGIGARLGRLAALRTTMGAAAPFLFALAFAQIGAGATLWISVALGAVGLAALWLLRAELLRQGRWAKLPD
jgi:MFS family permease